MIIYLPDGTEADVDFATQTITIDSVSRPLTDEELLRFAPLDDTPVEPALPLRMSGALELLRATVQDGAVSDAEFAQAFPVVLAALERFSDYGTWDDELGLEAIRILARIIQAVIIQGAQRSAAVTNTLTGTGLTIGTINSTLADLTARIEALEAP